MESSDKYFPFASESREREIHWCHCITSFGMPLQELELLTFKRTLYHWGVRFVTCFESTNNYKCVILNQILINVNVGEIIIWYYKERTRNQLKKGRALTGTRYTLGTRLNIAIGALTGVASEGVTEGIHYDTRSSGVTAWLAQCSYNRDHSV